MGDGDPDRVATGLCQALRHKRSRHLHRRCTTDRDFVPWRLYGFSALLKAASDKEDARKNSELCLWLAQQRTGNTLPEKSRSSRRLLITPPRKPKSHRLVKGCGGKSITAVVRPIARPVIRCGVARITVATVSIARWCGGGGRAVAAVVRPSAVTCDPSVNCTAICAAISPSLNACNAHRRSRSSYTGISAVQR